MFNLNENNRYNLFTQGIDMRKGAESLCGIVRTYRMNPINGEVYVFANKSRHLLKMLHWERGGFVVYYKPEFGIRKGLKSLVISINLCIFIVENQ